MKNGVFAVTNGVVSAQKKRSSDKLGFGVTVRVRVRAVSYTHLTLPTIYSV